VLVDLPGDAELYVDGVKAELGLGKRSFQTPAIDTGRDYFYTVKARVVREGKTLEQSKRVIVRGGETTRVAFDEIPAASKASAKVNVKLPAEAKLFVDGQPCPVTTFETPKLESGRAYFYTLKAEVVRNGKTISDSQRVLVEAGKTIDVDFSQLGSTTTVRR
jgi:uncharacterized protein (TIGR03000 family)